MTDVSDADKMRVNIWREEGSCTWFICCCLFYRAGYPEPSWVMSLPPLFLSLCFRPEGHAAQAKVYSSSSRYDSNVVFEVKTKQRENWAKKKHAHIRMHTFVNIGLSVCLNIILMTTLSNSQGASLTHTLVQKSNYQYRTSKIRLAKSD